MSNLRKIASVTVTSNREGIVGDAIRSVRDWVDAAVVVDLGITDGTLALITKLMDEVGKPVHVVKMGLEFTMADWRNAGMRMAQDLGFEWCVTLDTDERIHIGTVNIRKALDQISGNADVIFIRDSMDRYPKERFFKLPTENWFSGHAHESIPNKGSMVNFPHVTFTELPKTEEELKAKCEFIVVEKQRELAEDPTISRNWYYLGDALQVLGRYEEAIPAFCQCAELTTWDAEGAWSNLRAALCARKLKRTREALEHCARGLTYHPGYAELAWLAAVICMEAGQWWHGIYWARMSMVNGRPEIDIQHSSHCLPIGVWEGPYEILRDAYRFLGNTAESDKWAAKMGEVQAMPVAV